MKSQAKQLLEKMSNTTIVVKHCSKPSRHFKKMVITYHWSLAINKLQKIIMARCKEPLFKLKNEITNMKQSRSAQPSLTMLNSLNKHVRYLSQQVQENSQQNSKNSSISEEIEEPESTQRNSNAQKKVLKIDFQKIETNQYDIKESAHFHTQSSLDQLKFNEEFLDLFKKQKESSQFGQLSPDKIKEQENLIKKIIDSRPSKPNTDIKTFLSLLKKPQIEIEEPKQEQQQHQTIYIIIILIFIGMLSLYLVV